LREKKITEFDEVEEEELTVNMAKADESRMGAVAITIEHQPAGMAAWG